MKEALGLRIFLVTAWNDFENSTERVRASILDGEYGANANVREEGKIKRLSKICSRYYQRLGMMKSGNRHSKASSNECSVIAQ